MDVSFELEPAADDLIFFDWNFVRTMIGSALLRTSMERGTPLRINDFLHLNTTPDLLKIYAAASVDPRGALHILNSLMKELQYAKAMAEERERRNGGAEALRRSLQVEANGTYIEGLGIFWSTNRTDHAHLHGWKAIGVDAARIFGACVGSYPGDTALDEEAWFDWRVRCVIIAMNQLATNIQTLVNDKRDEIRVVRMSSSGATRRLVDLVQLAGIRKRYNEAIATTILEFVRAHRNPISPSRWDGSWPETLQGN